MSSEKLLTTVAMEKLQISLMRLHHHAHHRPWPELADRSAISVPGSLYEALSRIRKNLYYFQVNYLIVAAAVLAVFLVTRPLTLLLLASLAGAWLFLYVLRPPEKQVVIFGRAFSDCEALFGLCLATVLVLMLTSVVLVISSAMTVAAAVVCAHGAVHAPEDMFLVQEETWPWALGLFPSVGDGKPRSTASSIAAPVGPTMV